MKTIIIDGIEYNLTPKVLFKKGDFVVIQETTYLISKIEGLNVTLSCNGRECLFDIDVLKNAHLWTIEDAKDGDVLYSPCLKLLWIFKSRDTVYCGCNLNYNDGASLGKGYFERPTDAIPATKEQRATLMNAMADAGYTFDFEKKELKKISQRMISAEAKEAMYDKPACAWSEEDDVAINRIVACLENLNVADNDILLKDVDWLKSLKQRIGGE